MTKPGDPDDAVKALYRMIAYIRDEATRLHLAEVALLLAHAEDAAMVCRALRTVDGVCPSLPASPTWEH